MNVYFDTEFTGLVPRTSLISVGMVDENGKKFYAEFTDYDKSMCSDWIKENVLDNLILKNLNDGFEENYIWNEDLKEAGIVDHIEDMFVRGSSDYICDKLKRWFSEYENERIQLVSDVCHYDMTLLCNLFGGAFNLPDNVNPACYDINMDLMNYFADDTSGDYYNCEDETMSKAFDSSREKFIVKVLKKKLPEGAKHNSLYDAMIVKLIYEGLRNGR